MFRRELTLRERIRAFQEKYKLEDDDLILILLASLEKELEDFIRIKADLKSSFSGQLEDFNSFLHTLESNFNPKNLQELENRLIRLINVSRELEAIPKEIYGYFRDRFKIPTETLERIAESTFQEYQKEIKKRDTWILGAILIFVLGLSFFLFSWGRMQGKLETLKTVQEIERWQQTAEGRALQELGRLNPHLLDCQGEGLEQIRIKGKRICKPIGGSRGWILP